MHLAPPVVDRRTEVEPPGEEHHCLGPVLVQVTRLHDDATAPSPDWALPLPCRAFLLSACDLGTEACRDANARVAEWERSLRDAALEETCRKAWDETPRPPDAMIL